MKRRSLTRRQSAVLKAITDFIETNGYPPSMRELGAIMNLGAGTVHYHIHSLIDRGHLTHDGTDHGVAVLQTTSSEQPTLPLHGYVSLGLPLESADPTAPGVPVTTFQQRAADLVVVIRGAGLGPEGLEDGDKLLVRKTQTLLPGQVGLVARPDGSTVVKRVSHGRTGVRLRPVSGTLATETVPTVKVMGRVVGLIRAWL